MQIKKFVTIKVDADIDIVGIKILTRNEFLYNRQYIFDSDQRDWWWLASPSENEDFPNSVSVVLHGGISKHWNFPSSENFDVRPVLQISKPSDLLPGDDVEIFGKTWTVLKNKSLLMCRDSIKSMPFRKDWKAEDATDYDKSDIKIFLENWLKEKMREQEQSLEQDEEEEMEDFE